MEFIQGCADRARGRRMRYDAGVGTDAREAEPADEPAGPFDYESLHSLIQGLWGDIGARLGARRLADRLAAYALAAPDLVVLAGRVVRDGRVSRAQRGEILACAVYLASPIDLIPEVLFGPFGLVDDAMVAARLVDLLVNKVEPAVVDEYWPGDRTVLATLRELAADARKVFAAGLTQGVRVLIRRGARQVGRLLRDSGLDPRRLLST